MARMRIYVSRLVSFVKSCAVGRFDTPATVRVCALNNGLNLAVSKSSLSLDTSISRIRFEKIIVHTSLIHAVCVVGQYNFMLSDGKYLEVREGKIFEVTE